MTQRLEEAHHPAPHRHRAPVWLLAFALLGGPTAWFVQLNVSYAVTSNPCFGGGERLPADGGTGHVLTLLLYGLCLAVALAAAATGRLMHHRVREEVEGDHKALLEIGAGRTRFLATSGTLLGLGFALAIFVNIVALLLVPACAG